MTHKELVAGLAACRPGAHYVLHDEDFEGMQWLDDPATKPTLEEVVAAAQSVAYIAQRSLAYPSIYEFADAFIHLNNGDPTAMTEYVANCNAVKARFPKP